jgi:hypothetical protein
MIDERGNVRQGLGQLGAQVGCIPILIIGEDDRIGRIVADSVGCLGVLAYRIGPQAPCPGLLT